MYMCAVACGLPFVASVNTTTLLKSFPYEQIAKWGRSQSSFNIIQGESQWTFETRQGEEINKFLGIYVRMLVERKGRERREREEEERSK